MARVSVLAAGLAGALAGAAAPATITLDGTQTAHIYDGHGALSAGASSRALRDYPEPQRSQILDFLFKPSFGASLHQVKVEIGGDCQSTDGTEPSHMHTRDELSCSVDRGYELWLLQQAKARNPLIKTFALSWGVPQWVGNGSFFSEDNMKYQTAFATCVKESLGFDLDYIGVWNERSWGTPDYLAGLRSTLDSAGFGATQIVLPDGGHEEIQRALDAVTADPKGPFASAFTTIGYHYPCNAPLPEVNALGYAYWSSEDYSTVADWAGAGCWGRSLVQNYVRMNQTATIAWSLIWSVYQQLPYWGNGLMFALNPWSGYYEVNQAIWTTAHFTQFTQVGWRFLSVASGGSGKLPGGGAYTTLVPPTSTADFTVVLESLSGACLRCSADKTADQTVTFRLTGGLPGPGAKLYVWATNQSASFVQLPPVTVAADGTFTVALPADSMLTVTTLSTGTKGGFPSVPIPPAQPFPFPYSDDFNTGYAEDSLARYFSDQAGSFAVRGGSLVQVVPVDPGANAWVGDNDPISLIGDAAWEDFVLTVKASFNSSAAGAPHQPRPVVLHDTTRGVAAGDVGRVHVPARLAARGVTAQQLRPEAGTPAAIVAPCDAASAHQRFDLGAPVAGYFSNAAGAPGISGAACLNLNGCANNVVYYDCVTTGGTCAGSNNYSNLQWAIDPATGRVTSAYNGQCLQWAAAGSGGSMTVAACAPNPVAAGQSWTFNSTTKQLRLSGTSQCLTTPEPATYVQLCGRITGYSGFTVQTVPGYCARFDSANGGTWSITVGPGKGVVAAGPLGIPGFDPTVPATYGLRLQGNVVAPSVNGVELAAYVDDDATYAVGLASLGSGYHHAVFDDFAVDRVPAAGAA